MSVITAASWTASARLRLSRAGIILAVFVGLAAGVVLVGATVVPSGVRQVQQLSNDAPRYAAELRRNAT